MDTPNVPETANAGLAGSAPAPAGSEESAPSVEPQVTPAATPASAPAVEPQETPAVEPDPNQKHAPGDTGEPGAEPAGEEKVTLEEHVKLRKRAQAAETRNAFLEGRLQSPPPPAASAPETKPVPPKFIPLEDFDGSYEDWLVAKTRHEINWDNDQKQITVQSSAVDQTYFNRCNKANENIPDLQETINTTQLPRYDDSVVTAVKKSDLGPQIIYYLAKNPAEAVRLAQMDPGLAIMEIGSFREKINTSIQPKTKKATGAPPPINPGNGAGATVITNLADKGMEDYAKARDAEVFVKVEGRMVKR